MAASVTDLLEGISGRSSSSDMEGRTLLPFKSILAHFGADIMWECVWHSHCRTAAWATHFKKAGVGRPLTFLPLLKN